MVVILVGMLEHLLLFARLKGLSFGERVLVIDYKPDTKTAFKRTAHFVRLVCNNELSSSIVTVYFGEDTSKVLDYPISSVELF